MNKNQSGFSVIEIVLVIVVILVLGAIGWYKLGNKNGDNEADSTTSLSPTTEQPIKLSMNYKKPDGWIEKVVVTTKEITIISFTSEEAELLLVTQIASDFRLDRLPEIEGYKVSSTKEEIKLYSALYADQYVTSKNDKEYQTTTFLLGIRYDVIMNKNDYENAQYAKTYQEFLDSFEPNGYMPGQ